MGLPTIDLLEKVTLTVQFFKYVPLGFVHVWEREGWIVTGILNDTHHARYSVCMTPGPDCKFMEDGEPCCPHIDEAA